MTITYDFLNFLFTGLSLILILGGAFLAYCKLFDPDNNPVRQVQYFIEEKRMERRSAIDDAMHFRHLEDPETYLWNDMLMNPDQP